LPLLSWEGCDEDHTVLCHMTQRAMSQTYAPHFETPLTQK
jgi:hypothetical protein